MLLFMDNFKKMTLGVGKHVIGRLHAQASHEKEVWFIQYTVFTAACAV